VIKVVEKYICIAKCPELDDIESKHCTRTVKSEEELRELRNEECPCGNNSNFVKESKCLELNI
jgi:hypothetical protein